MMNSLTQVALFYSTTLCFIGLATFLGTGGFGTFWRLTGLFGLATLEGFCLLQNKDPSWILFGWRTTHERILILRQCTVALFIALSQLGPILFPKQKFHLKQSLFHMEELASMVLKEAKHGVKSSFEPIAQDPHALGKMQREMEKLAIDLKLQEDKGRLKKVQ
jgi:hypothetical protein